MTTRRAPESGLTALRRRAVSAITPGASLAFVLIGFAASGGCLLPATALACSGKIYLTFDTGSMSQAALIAATLQRFNAKAAFFLANEKTVNGDMSLDPGWAPYWRQLAAQGHLFGSHTLDHITVQRDLAGGAIEVKPGFGAQAGQRQQLSSAAYCSQLRAVDQRFRQLTGRALDPLWRAPGGHLSANALAAAKQCGFQHVGWAAAGFSGDELPSERYPNPQLLAKSLRELKNGDIFMAHLGIWSRKDAWAPANLSALLDGLQRKGFCFASLREHPQYAAWLASASAGTGADGNANTNTNADGNALANAPVAGSARVPAPVPSVAHPSSSAKRH